MRTNYDRMVRLLAPAVFGAAAVFVAAGAATLISFVRSGAAVGDLIVFEPNAGPVADTEPRLVVHRPDQFGCVLDLNTIRQSGGSLIIEARLSGDGQNYRLHWAGERTTADSGDCGHSADLIVDHSDLDNLAVAAGGFGLGHKRTPVFTTALAN
jgi:hypothetical protein